MANYQFKFRRNTAGYWTTHNPYLADGEPVLEISTDGSPDKLKFGPGRWNDLPYFADSGGNDDPGNDPRIGNMSSLTTTDKTSVVNAINEVDTPTVPLTSLYTNAKAG